MLPLVSFPSSYITRKMSIFLNFAVKFDVLLLWLLWNKCNG